MNNYQARNINSDNKSEFLYLEKIIPRILPIFSCNVRFFLFLEFFEPLN